MSTKNLFEPCTREANGSGFHPKMFGEKQPFGIGKGNRKTYSRMEN